MRGVFYSVLFLLSSGTAFSQKVSAGIESSLLFSRIKGNGMDASLRQGYELGAWVRYGIGGRWSIKPGLYYSFEHFRAADNFTTYYINQVRSSGYNADVYLSSLHIPVLMQYQLLPKLGLQGGMEFSFVSEEDSKLLKSTQRVFRNSGRSAILGAEIQLKPVHFYVRYKYGLSDVNNINSVHRWTVQGIQAGIGLRLF